MYKKISISVLFLVILMGSFLCLGCSSSKKYYSSKSKEYRKLKRKYEKYDCGCFMIPSTYPFHPFMVFSEPEC
jgi:hypothetical protein